MPHVIEQLSWWDHHPPHVVPHPEDDVRHPSTPESVALWSWYLDRVGARQTRMVGPGPTRPNTQPAPGDQSPTGDDDSPGHFPGKSPGDSDQINPLGRHRYGVLAQPVEVHLDEVCRAIRAFADGGSIPDGPLRAPERSAVFLSLYVGDSSEIGPRGGLREPAFMVAMDNDPLNAAAGIYPSVIWNLSFPTRRNQLFFITSTIRHREWPRVYRYDTVDRMVTGARLHITDHEEAKIYRLRGGHLASEWLRRCSRRRVFGGRDDYLASESPATFANCRDRMNIRAAGKRLGRWTLSEPGGDPEMLE